MGFFYSNDGRSFSTTHSNPQVFLTSKGIEDNSSAMIIQKWWRKNSQKTKKRRNASARIQNWWKENRDSEYYYLFIENSNFYIEELYNRLLTVIIPGIHYICIKKKDTFPKCILIKTNLDKSVLNNEIKEVLRLVGYNYQFVLNKN
jgi:hypothetical protein